MHYINRLPFLLALIAGLLTGILRYRVVKNSQVYIGMSISMLVFFFIGIYIRKLLKDIIKTIEEKRKEREEKEKKEKEEKQNNKVGQNIDFSVGDNNDTKNVDTGERFIPVNEFIEKEINQ